MLAVCSEIGELKVTSLTLILFGECLCQSCVSELVRFREENMRHILFTGAVTFA